jgi:hypothetical protein
VNEPGIYVLQKNTFEGLCGKLHGFNLRLLDYSTHRDCILF